MSVAKFSDLGANDVVVFQEFCAFLGAKLGRLSVELAPYTEPILKSRRGRIVQGDSRLATSRCFRRRENVSQFCDGPDSIADAKGAAIS